MIKIESGVEQMHPMMPVEGYDTYLYRYWQGTVEIKVLFMTVPGEVPEIGDFIEGGLLIKRDGWQINDDTSKWEVLPKETW